MTAFPTASSDHAALADAIETVSYVAPSDPFVLDDHGLPIAAEEADDPDDE